MTHSDACTTLVAGFEGLRLKAYQDQVGIWTIGFGHTHNVSPDETCTEEQARKWLNTDLMMADRAVNKAIARVVNQNEFDAMVSLAYNIGGNAFLHSTLVRKLNDMDFSGAADEFLVWNHAGGKINPGLTTRRIAERRLFLSPVLVAQ